jgi:hypothetical protein
LYPLTEVPSGAVDQLAAKILNANSRDAEPTEEQVARYVRPVLELNDLIGILTDRYLEVVIRHGGLAGKPETLEEIGKSYDVSSNAIRLIEIKAFAILQREIGRREAKRQWESAATFEEKLAVPLLVLDLPLKLYRALRRDWGTDYATLGDLVAQNESELVLVRGIGDRAVADIKASLADLGLKLAD